MRVHLLGVLVLLLAGCGGGRLPGMDAGPSCAVSCAAGEECVQGGCLKGCYGEQDCPGGTPCSASTECLPPPGCGAGDGGCPAVCYGHCR